MPLQRLRRILQHPLQVQVESTPALAAEVQAVAARRPPNPYRKTPVEYPPLVGGPSLDIRAIDLLRKIGELTTPTTLNLARLSASWATRRYFWAIADPAGRPAPAPFYLSRDARRMERHQKTLLSDEFGMGFAGLFSERILGTTDVIDVEFALADPVRYFGAQAHQYMRTRPDFLTWGPNPPVYILEAKGSQTQWQGVLKQLCRAMEQLPSVAIPGQTSVQLVAATYLESRRTRLLVLDPPEDTPDEPKGDPEKESANRFTPRREGKRYVFRDEESARTKMQAGVALHLLRWASQHETARKFERSMDVLDVFPAPPNARRAVVETPRGDFVGVRVPLVPELDPAGPQIFRGLRSDVLKTLETGDPEAVGELDQVPVGVGLDDSRLSVGPRGTCLLVEGLDI